MATVLLGVLRKAEKSQAAQGSRGLVSPASKQGPALVSGVNVTLPVMYIRDAQLNRALGKKNPGCQDRFQLPLPTNVCFLNFLLQQCPFGKVLPSICFLSPNSELYQFV